MKSGISPYLVLACCVTCLGSSLLYGYQIAVFNGPKKHVECFLCESMLNIRPCPHYLDSLNASSEAWLLRTNWSLPSNNTDSGGINGSFLLQHMASAAAANEKVLHKVGFYYSLLTTVWIVCGAIGAFCTGAISNFFGRRNGLLFNSAFAVAGAAVGAPAVHASAPYLLYIGRGLSGFNCGVTIGLASIYLTEIAPVRYRGAIGACHQLAVTVGILLAFAVSGLEQAFNRQQLWIVAFTLTGIPGLLSMALLPLCPESPRFLYINRGDESGARTALAKLYPGVSAQVHIDEMAAETRLKSPTADDDATKFSFGQLFTLADLRMPVALAVCVQIMQQLSGINAVMSYSTAMMNACGIPQSSVPYVNVGFSGFVVLCTVVSLPLLERLGRRSLLLWPTAVLAASLVVLCVTAVVAKQTESPDSKQAASVLFVVFIFVYTSSFSFGLGTIPGFIVAELFRQEPRSAAYSLSQGVQWIANLLVSTTFVNLQLAIEGYVFLVYLCVVGPLWVFFYACMPETRGRSFDAVANDLAFPGFCQRRRRRAFHVIDDVIINGGEVGEGGEDGGGPDQAGTGIMHDPKGSSV